MSFRTLGSGLNHAFPRDPLVTLCALDGYIWISILFSHLWGNGHSYIVILDRSGEIEIWRSGGWSKCNISANINLIEDVEGSSTELRKETRSNNIGRSVWI